MLNKTTYETDKYKIIIQKYGKEWLLQVFEGSGGTKIHEWVEFDAYEKADNYVINKYLTKATKQNQEVLPGQLSISEMGV